jgi:hypothetical protein
MWVVQDFARPPLLAHGIMAIKRWEEPQVRLVKVSPVETIVCCKVALPKRASVSKVILMKAAHRSPDSREAVPCTSAVDGHYVDLVVEHIKPDASPCAVHPTDTNPDLKSSQRIELPRASPAHSTSG